MKSFFKSLKDKFFKFWQYAKVFLSAWQNCLFVACIVLSIVFLCLWNVAPWCQIVGLAFLTISLCCVAIIFTNFYSTFVRLINTQKQEILQDLATKFDKPEYLQLKTPFAEKDEAAIQQQIKNYRTIMFFFWIVFVICVYVFIMFLLK